MTMVVVYSTTVSTNYNTTTGESSDIPRGSDYGARTVYVITSTTVRSAQPPDMTRMAQTLRLVSNIHWVIVENSTHISPWLQNLVQYNRLNHTLITCRDVAPPGVRQEPGAKQKNCGLLWLRKADIMEV